MLLLLRLPLSCFINNYYQELQETSENIAANSNWFFHILFRVRQLFSFELTVRMNSTQFLSTCALLRVFEQNTASVFRLSKRTVANRNNANEGAQCAIT